LADQPVKFRWADVADEELKPGLKRRMLWSRRAMLARITLKRGCTVPEHKHASEQFTYVIRGALRFTLKGGRETTVRAGEVLLIPSNVEHAAEALEDTIDLDIFIPPRRDWITRQDRYLRR
jgi:quercetin dioxygenase-like cupin family protein